MISGVYAIINDVNNKVYIGCSKNIPKRFIDHKYRLDCGIHENEYLQNAYNKYGANSFSFLVIDECDSDIMAAIEHYWVNMLGSLNRNLGYNIHKTSCELFGGKHDEISKLKISKHIKANPRGACVKGSKRSSETRRKISLSKKGKPVSEATSLAKLKAVSKPVINTITGEVYPSAAECARINSKSLTYLRNMLNGLRKNTSPYLYYRERNIEQRDVAHH